MFNKNLFSKRTLAFAFLGFVILLGSCSRGGSPFLSSSRKSRGKSSNSIGVYKVGTPYQVDGVWYYPREDYSYSEVGIASWYGPNFHNKLTANGEIYDMNMPTAAHRTLPLPSVVRVTNMENGRVAILTVNDRGPFANNRILDVSRRGAQLLGFMEKGTAKVRVEILPEESRKLKKQALGIVEEEKEEKIAYNESEYKVDKENKNNIKPLISYESETGVSKESNLEEDTKQRPSYLPPLANPRPLKVQNIQDVKTSSYSKSSYSSSNNNKGLSKKTYSSMNKKTVKKSSTAGNVAQKVATTSTVTPLSKAFFVQAGAFSNYENATRLERTLSAIGGTVISPVDVNGRTLYRVRVGPAKTKDQASNFLQKVKAFGHSGARIVKDKVRASSKKENVRNIINQQ